MNTRNLLTGFFLLVATLTQGALALAQSGESSVKVLAHGPAGLRIEGASSNVSVAEDASAMTFKVAIAPIETGIALRDQHLRELLEADKFPDAVLRIPLSAITFPKKGKTAEGTARGELTLRDRSHPVDVRYRAELGSGGVAKVKGSLRVDMRDFEIKHPSYLGLGVAPEVDVQVELSVKLDVEVAVEGQ